MLFHFGVCHADIYFALVVEQYSDASEGDEDDEDGKEEAPPPSEPPSPQYGIRDLPSRSPASGSFSTSQFSNTSQTSPSKLTNSNVPTSPSKFNPPHSHFIPSTNTNANPLPRPPAMQRGAGGAHSAPHPSFSSASSAFGESRSKTLQFASSPPGSGNGNESVNWPNDVPRLPRGPVGTNTSQFASERGRHDPLDESPPVSVVRARSVSPAKGRERAVPRINLPDDANVNGRAPPVPKINLPGDDDEDDNEGEGPMISVSPPAIAVSRPPAPEMPSISISVSEPTSSPSISVSGPPSINVQPSSSRPDPVVFEVPGVSFVGPASSPAGGAGRKLPARPGPGSTQTQTGVSGARGANGMRGGGGGGLVCPACHGPILGRIVNAMGARWHPGCFRCCACDELLEHVSSYEAEGKAWCHLDYHEVRFSSFLAWKEMFSSFLICFVSFYRCPSEIRTEVF